MFTGVCVDVPTLSLSLPASVSISELGRTVLGCVLSLSLSLLVVSVSCCLCRPDCRLRLRGLETKTSCINQSVAVVTLLLATFSNIGKVQSGFRDERERAERNE